MNYLRRQRAGSPPEATLHVWARRSIGAAGAAGAVIASSWSHVRGGGPSDGIVGLLSLLLPVLVVAMPVGAVIGQRRRSFRTLLGALVALQPAVHLSMPGHGTAMGTSPMADMPMGESTMTVATAHSSIDPAVMVAAHTAAVVILAVVLRYGWQWITTMPAVLTAAIGQRRITVWFSMPEVAMLAAVRVDAPTAPHRTTNWSRGPPR